MIITSPTSAAVSVCEMFEDTPLGNLTNTTPTHGGGYWEVSVPSSTTLQVINDPTGSGHGQVVEYYDTNYSDYLNFQFTLDQSRNETLVYSFDMYLTPDASNTLTPAVMGTNGEIMRQVWYRNSGVVYNYVGSSVTPVSGSPILPNVWYHVVYTMNTLTSGSMPTYDFLVTRISDGVVMINATGISGRYQNGTSQEYLKFGFTPTYPDSRNHFYLDNVRIVSYDRTETFENIPVGNLTNSTPTHSGGTWDVSVPSGTTLQVVNDSTVGGHGRVVEYNDTNSSESLNFLFQMTPTANDCIEYSFDVCLASDANNIMAPVAIGTGNQAMYQAWYLSSGLAYNYIDGSTYLLDNSTISTNTWYHVVYTMYPLRNGAYAGYDCWVTRESDGKVIHDLKWLSGRYTNGAGAQYSKFGFIPPGASSIGHFYVDNFHVGSKGNLAYQKTYTCTPTPNYSTTIPGDAADLTDGIYTSTASGVYWVNTGNVGWQVTTQGISINVDLGSIQPIRGVSLNFFIYYPSAIYILASTDNVNFFEIGDLTRLTKAIPVLGGGYYPSFRYQTEQLKTKARYLKLFVISPDVFTFCDELEVYQGSPSFVNNPYPGSPVTTTELLQRTSQLTQNGCRFRFKADLIQTQFRIDNSTILDSTKTTLLQQAKSLAQQIDRAPDFPASQYQCDQFKAIVPYNDPGQLHKQVFKLNAKLLEAKGLGSLTAWHTHPYLRLGLFDEPAGTPTLNVSMMANEFRSDVLNLTNASQDNITVSLDIRNLPGVTNPSYVRVYQVEPVDTRARAVVSAALTELSPSGGAYTSVAPSGMTRQIWFSFHPVGLPAGDYSGTVHVQSSALITDVALNFSLANISFPAAPDFNFGMWDYVDFVPSYGITSANRAAAVEDMKDHFVDVAWGCTMPAQPTGLDGNGNIILPENAFSAFDNWVLNLRTEARCYIISFQSLTENTTFAGYARGTANFNSALSQWSAAWADHNRQIGLAPGQVGIALIDEPSTDTQFQTTLDWASAFKSGSSENLVFMDIASFITDLSQTAKDALNYVDIVCPALPITQQQTIMNYLEQLRQQGKILWFYNAGSPAQLLDPTGYYRIQPWYAYVYNFVGSHFWAYADTEVNSSWNEYPAIGLSNWAPCYIDNNTITITKHWEAAREGIEDYQYLKMLKNRSDQLASTDPNNPLVAEAVNFLANQPSSVVNTVKNNNLYGISSPDVPDQSRLGALDILKRMPNPSLNGTVVLGNFNGNVTTVQVTVELRGTLARTESVSLDTFGHFTILNVAPGTYAVRVKASHWLAGLQAGIIVVESSDKMILTAFSLVNGDCDEDNEVTSSDLSIVLAAMDSTVDPQADLNGNGAVTAADLAIVLGNMDLMGNE